MEPVLNYHIAQPLPAAEAALREALQAEGFGVLTEVDVTAVFRAKLGIETAPYRLLGVCNPAIASRALEADPHVGAFLPCGIALYEGADHETTAVLQNPELIAASFAAPGLEEVAADTVGRLTRALARVGTAA